MDASNAKVRAFVALNIPGAWQTALADLQRELKLQLRGPAFRWANPEQMHLTLRFLGSISMDEAQAVSASLERIAKETAPFRLGARSLGCFPNPRRARVLWVGLCGSLEPLNNLHAEIGRATAQIGEPPDDRPFSPHLTLARIKEPSREDLRALPRALDRSFSLEDWSAASIRLVRSHLGAGGARHEALSIHAFRPRGGKFSR